MSITEFLLARIAEDETVAQSAAETTAPDEWDNPTQGGNYYPADVAFWDRITPARVLSECAAKRAIAELWEDEPTDGGFLLEGVDAGHVIAIDQTVRHLAAVYADHRDYDQEWSTRLP